MSATGFGYFLRDILGCFINLAVTPAYKINAIVFYSINLVAF